MDKILINIDSRQRDYTMYPDSCYFKLGTDYNSKYQNYLNFKNIDYIKLSSIEIPNSFYVFTEKRFNTFFTINAIHLGTTSDVLPSNPLYQYPSNQEILEGEDKINIIEGNYDLDVLANHLNQVLNLKYYNVGYYLINNPIFYVLFGLNVRIDRITNKIIIENKSKDYKFDINFSNNNTDYNSLGYILGYRLESYNLSEAQGYYFPNIIAECGSDIGGEKYIFLRLNDYGNIYINHKHPTKVFAKIILNYDKDSYIFNNNSDHINRENKFRLPVNINKFEIELLDAYNRRLNNNGIDFSFTLELGHINDSKQYNNQINYLKLNEITYTDNIKTISPVKDDHYFINSKTTENPSEFLNKLFLNYNKPEINITNDVKYLEERRKKIKVKKNKKIIDFKY